MTRDTEYREKGAPDLLPSDLQNLVRYGTHPHLVWAASKEQPC